MSLAPGSLLPRTTCPHCWTTFSPEDVLWISAHADLLGDPRLGPEQQQRFLPTRFNTDGHALDARGFVCQAMACPKCHLGLPRAFLEIEPTFVSILGTPACGKSFFLAAMTWQLRRDLPRFFSVSFADADPVTNRTLNEYEEALFLNPHAEQLVPLADLIRKTELQGGELYDVVQYGNQSVSYPRPFLFVVRPQDNHPRAEAEKELARVLCLYDNAGEHFQPGQDTTGSPVTRHMAQARVLLFLFDPTQDVRFQKLCQSRQLSVVSPGRTSRQEAVLQEAIARVRRVLGLPQSARHDRPLIIVLTKCDAWDRLLAETKAGEPWVARDGIASLDVEQIERRSRQARALMLQACPELVATAEDFAQEVLYVPASALGQSPERVLPDRGPPAIRPCDIRPTWVTVPLLYSMSRWMPGLVPTLRRPARGGGIAATEIRAGLTK
jgi:hypothetical protein